MATRSKKARPAGTQRATVLARPRPAASSSPISEPAADPGARRRVVIVIAATLAVLAICLLVTLSTSAPRLAGQNGVPTYATLMSTDGSPDAFCQDGEVLPKDSESITLSITALQGSGPRVDVRATKNGRVLARGSRSPGWSGNEVQVPVTEVSRSAANVRVCASVGGGAPVAFRGVPAGKTFFGLGAAPKHDRMWIQYERSASESWWSLAPTMIHRLGLVQARQTPLVALLAVLFMLSVLGIAIRLLTYSRTRAPPSDEQSIPTTSRRSPLRRIPTTAWICALVAILNAGTWALITPPFQVYDELDHFAYVQSLAETGHPPTESNFNHSDEEAVTLRDLNFLEQVQHRNVGLWSSVERQRLDRDLGRDPSRVGPGAGTATSQPPLYYALAVIPYELGRGGSLLDRLLLMRMLSVLLAGITVLFVFLFVRETFPSTPWAWTVAGLATAVQPLFGHTLGGVNSDALLFATSAALFYLLARSFRRGLTTKLALAIGVAIAVGLLSKLTFAALVPGAVIGLCWLSIRDRRGSWLAALRLPLLAIGVAAVPFVATTLLDHLVWDRGSRGSTSSAGLLNASASAEGNLADQIAYIWQWYLPRLPGQPDLISGWPLREWWLPTFFGKFGYSATTHPQWLRDIALPLGSIGLALAAWTLVRARRVLDRRRIELVSYGLMAVGLILGIGAASYAAASTQGAVYLTQGRYFWPLAALMASVVVLASRAGGRRWGPALGALIVILAIGQDIAGQLLVFSKWYS
ncbi:MAG TPA: DUF2142 domain-containing protein [Thermoleophilaceae bacterium]